VLQVFVEAYKLPVGFVMAALWNRAGHYILPCDFYFLLLFPLVSAVGDWMPTILPHMVWP